VFCAVAHPWGGEPFAGSLLVPEWKNHKLGADE